ncbi:hypothetical protein TNIN_28461 [Trichonephila inaurata madagascariensis]|uniref:Uncharacterized protein n=1 Tax=Trichonephila inaurata madagascariensis TaxID=2747483 RepID=A0A8X7CDZ0_9ARAC|nr:hypothetical protein TNIN_28461 [Trichonephila inaurata madagascariensis]
MKTAFSGFHIPPTERHLCTPNNDPPSFNNDSPPPPLFQKICHSGLGSSPIQWFLGATVRSGESPLSENPLRYNEEESSFITCTCIIDKIQLG